MAEEPWKEGGDYQLRQVSALSCFLSLQFLDGL